VVVVGDIHGQFYDLVHLIEKAGDPSVLNYVFLGDYVDRGIYSLECLMLLLAMKLTYPSRFYLMRGNHESRTMTEYFTFREEVLEKYDNEVYEAILKMFDTMPLVAVVNQEYLCMHGGVSPNMRTLEEINKANRFQEVPLEGLLCDILWSDPIEDDIADKYDFMENPER
jgi:serine/threonine-protein phosphatase 2B catalytic subunit